MSKYLVTSGSQFTPFTYDELVKPLMYMQQRHDTAQEQADTLAMEAGAIGSMLDGTSPRAKQMYDNFMSSVDNLVQDLMKNGYNRNTANALSAARRMYGKDITKINAAITNRAKAINSYDEDVKKDKTLIAERDPRNLSIDDWLDNPYAGNYNSYSGAMLTAQASAIGQNLKRDIDENGGTWKRILGGQYFEKDEFAGFTANEIKEAIYGMVNGEESQNERIKVLQSAMQNVYNSSGMDTWATPEQKARAYQYIGDGIYSAIGEKKSSQLQDRSYMSPYQSAVLENQRAKNTAKNGNGSQTSIGPEIVSLRGNVLNGIGDSKKAKEFVDKTSAYEALSTVNQLMKSGALRNPNGTLSDAANDAVMKLYNNDYYKQLSAGQEKFLSNADLDSILETLGSELDKMETNDHMYSFEVTPAAAQNVARNVFKMNIGQLNGKQGDKLAGAVAKYADDKSVSGKELLSILGSENIAVGFDAQSGKIVMQRKAPDEKESAGKYDDRIVYLDPKTVLAGTYGYVNGQTVDLRQLAEFLHNSYSDMVKNGDEKKRAIFNMYVECLAQGLFDSSNTAWSPNNYREGWSAKTGGDYGQYEEYDDDYYFE